MQPLHHRSARSRVDITAYAALASHYPGRLTNRKRCRLTGNTRPEANPKNDRGPVSDSLDLEHILLQLQRSPEERKLKQYRLHERKNSPNFHQWLTGDQLAQQFGVAQADIDKITDWLEYHGFRVNQVFADRMMIDFSGSAGQLREAFHTSIHKLEVNGESMSPT